MDGGVIITMRMLMVGKEIGGIIGKGGANVEAFRQESGARITISAAQAAPERIVTITGGQTQIHKACELIAEKLNKDLNSGLSSGATNKVPVTIRLIVPASQCGSIIGKGGVKIKEIRDSTGCAIQVQSEMLPNSSERAVTLSGAPTTIIHCIDMLIDVMIQYPAKTATVPYKPQGGAAPFIFHQGQTYMLHGQYAIPTPDIGKLNKPSGLSKFHGGREKSHYRSTVPEVDDDEASLDDFPQQSVESIANTNLPVRLVSINTQEVTVGNDVMGCIIGKGGARINEIRSLSGAQIKINQGVKEEKEENDDTEQEVKPRERKITITGSPEEISMALYLINLSVQMFSSPDKPGSFQSSRRGMQIPLSDTFGPPSLLGQPPLFGGGGFFGGRMPPGAYGAALFSAKRSLLASSSSRQRGGYKSRRSKPSGETYSDVDFTADVDLSGDASPNGKDKRKSKREKFQPY